MPNGNNKNILNFEDSTLPVLKATCDLFEKWNIKTALLVDYQV
jgi:hypothetical protein